MGYVTVFRTERRRGRKWDILVSDNEYPALHGKNVPFVVRVGSNKEETLKDAIQRAIDIYKTERIIRCGEISPFVVEHITRFGVSGRILKKLSLETLGLSK